MEAGRTLLLGKLCSLMEPFSRCLGQTIENKGNGALIKKAICFLARVTLSLLTAGEFWSKIHQIQVELIRD